MKTHIIIHAELSANFCRLVFVPLARSRAITNNQQETLGYYDDAINDYNQVIEINPKNARAYLGRRNTKYKNNDKGGACNDWKESEKPGFEYAYEIIKNYCK